MTGSNGSIAGATS